jgi:hypothetical protein
VKLLLLSVVTGCLALIATGMLISLALLALAVPISIAMVLVTIGIVRANHRNNGSFQLLISHGEGKQGYWHPCKDCSGGAQTLIEDKGWGPIPDHWKIVQPDSPYFESKMANVRNCGTCTGAGGFWRGYPPVAELTFTE